MILPQLTNDVIPLSQIKLHSRPGNLVSYKRTGVLEFRAGYRPSETGPHRSPKEGPGREDRPPIPPAGAARLQELYNLVRPAPAFERLNGNVNVSDNCRFINEEGLGIVCGFKYFYFIIIFLYI